MSTIPLALQTILVGGAKIDLSNVQLSDHLQLDEVHLEGGDIRVDLPRNEGETERVMAMEMYYRNKTFWAWQDAEWIEIIASSTAAFGARYGRTYKGRQLHPARREIPVLAYLLTAPADIDPLLAPFTITSIARKIWGEETLSAHVQ